MPLEHVITDHRRVTGLQLRRYPQHFFYVYEGVNILYV